VIDTHCHLTHPRFADDAGEVIARARAAGVEACLTIGTGIEDALAAHGLARAYPGSIHAAAGLDPFSSHAAGERFDAALAALEALHREGGFAAVGEIGLDYHYDLDPRPVQAARFEKQLDLARSLDRPVIIHVREAHDDLAAILAAHPGHRGVIHSFTAGPAEAERYLALGWHLGFGGVATFRNAESVRDAARLTPVDRLLVETDAPYLAPLPHRGERCEPRHVAVTLAALANVRGVTTEELDAATTANARRLFGWAA
jgi:TatD DNase family protein